MRGYSEQNAVSERLVRNIVYTAIDCCKPSGVQKLTFDWRQRGVSVAFIIRHSSFGDWWLLRSDSDAPPYLVGRYSDSTVMQGIIGQAVGQLENRYGLEYKYDRESLPAVTPVYDDPPSVKTGLFRRVGRWVRERFTGGPVPKYPC